MLKNLFGFLDVANGLAAPTLEESSSQTSSAKTVRESLPVKLAIEPTFEDVELTIRAAYKQVFGNVHVMESQRLLSAESLFRDGQLTTKEFVRTLAKSSLYRSLVLEKCSNVRVVELNFQHFLGRAPEDAEEISQHIAIIVNEGFDAEVDSYFESDEYKQNFGQSIVPYYVSYSTQTGKNVAGYTRIDKLVRGASGSDISMLASGSSQLQKDLFQTLVYPPQPVVFNLKALKVAKSLGTKPASGSKVKSPSPPQPSEAVTDVPLVQVQIFPEDRAKTSADRYRDAYSGVSIVEFYGDSVSQENLDLIVRAAYRQVFGNAYLMESERLREAESQVRSGQINVSEFIRRLAKSDRYRSLFWEKYPPVTAIELNFKHFLGRAPESAEISQHLNILAEGGFDAEIDSYFTSDEYYSAFGTGQVPYPRGYKTQAGVNAAGFTQAFPLLGPACSSDKSTFGSARSVLEAGLLVDKPGTVPDIRAIPESFSKELSEVPTPRIPKMFKGMAMDLLSKQNSYTRFRPSAAFTKSAFAKG